MKIDPRPSALERQRRILGSLGILMIAAGLLLNVRAVEVLLVFDGNLESQASRGVILAAQVALVALGTVLLVLQGVPYSLWSGGAVAIGVISYALLIEPAPQRVLDCRAGEGNCFQTAIRAWYGTEDCWYSTPERCKPLRRDLQSISYVTDFTNYVKGPFSLSPPMAEPIDVELRSPWDLDFLPDGTMVITEREGRVVQVGPDWSRTLLEIQPLVSWGAGLLSVAVDPEFEETQRLFLYSWTGFDTSHPEFSERPEWLARILGQVSSYRLDGDSLRREGIVLDSIPGSPMHPGGRMAIGPDGKLYISTGDAHDEHLAQDLESLAGKILRLNLDGSVPEDNPFPGSPVYSLGHRNPQGLAWHPVTGELYQAEHGPDRMDEVNRVVPGGNYGWPGMSCGDDTPWEVEGFDRSAATLPVKCFDDYTMAPSGIAFMDDPESPWYGSLFVAGLRGKHVRRFEIEGSDVRSEEIFFVAEGPGQRGFQNLQRDISHRIRHVAVRDGAIYVLGNERGLIRLVPQ